MEKSAAWYGYASDIRSATPWDAARSAGIATADVHWPVSVGAPIDANLPQIWRTGHADDRKPFAALSTPELMGPLESALGRYADGIDESVDVDATRSRFAARIIAEHKPGLMTVYFAALDHGEHVAGVDSAVDPANGIDRIHDRAATARYGGAREAEFVVLFKPGFEVGADPTAATVAPSKLRGLQGYSPDVPAMNATFLMTGSGIPAHRSLGEIDMRDIAPTAHVLGVHIADTVGKPLLP